MGGRGGADGISPAWVSLFVDIQWTAYPANHASLSRGIVRAGNCDLRGFVPSLGWSVSYSPWLPEWDWPHLWFGRDAQLPPGLWLMELPLWVPTLAAALVLVPVWAIRRTARKRFGAGRCGQCAYDLTGITGPCPECGREQEQKA